MAHLAGQPASQAGSSTVEDAREFLERVETTLNDLAIRASRAAWVQSTYITVDTQAMAASANEAQIAATTAFVKEAARFREVQLPPELARKMHLLRLQLTMPAPDDASERAELTRLASSLEADYGKGKYCRPAGPGAAEECLDITAIERIMAESRNPRELLELWAGWRRIAPPMRERYTRFVELTNKGARELGFADTGALWRSGYDMPPDAFEAEVDAQVHRARAGTMADHARPVAARGPATIAIHDDGDVAGDARRGGQRVHADAIRPPSAPVPWP